MSRLNESRVHGALQQGARYLAQGMTLEAGWRR